MSVVEMKIATVFFDDQSIWKDGKMLRSSIKNKLASLSDPVYRADIEQG